MLLRTYPLIQHPAFVRFVAEAEVLNLEFEQSPAFRVKRELPALPTATAIADYLSVSHRIVHAILMRPSGHYRTFSIPKRSGGERVIKAPRTFLKVVQWWILDTILSWQPVHQASFGFTRGRSYVDNARQHIGARHILNVDICDFFPSTSARLVADEFRKLGYSDVVAKDLAKLTSCDECLPQGAPTSPALSNLIFRTFDDHLNEVAVAAGLKYTRYADDLTFSSTCRIDSALVAKIGEIISGGGYALNHKKTRFMGPNQQKEVTGIIIGADGIGLDRDFLNSCRGWFHKVASQPLDYIALEPRLRGTYELIRQVDGRGSRRVLEIGAEALARLAAARAAILI